MREYKKAINIKTIAATGEHNLATEVKFYGEVSPAMQAVAIKLNTSDKSMSAIIEIEYIPQIVDLLLHAYNTAKLNRTTKLLPEINTTK